jgi:hypothetical protein
MLTLTVISISFSTVPQLPGTKRTVHFELLDLEFRFYLFFIRPLHGKPLSRPSHTPHSIFHYIHISPLRILKVDIRNMFDCDRIIEGPSHQAETEG